MFGADVMSVLDALRVNASQLCGETWPTLHSFLKTNYADRLSTWQMVRLPDFTNMRFVPEPGNLGTWLGERMQAFPDLTKAVQRFLNERRHTRPIAYRLSQGAEQIAELHAAAENGPALSGSTVRQAAGGLPEAWAEFCQQVPELIKNPGLTTEQRIRQISKLGSDMMLAAGDGIDMAFVTGVLVGSQSAQQ